jgi:hypothetical protein
MTPKAQRIAIAEACGWKETHIMQMGAKGKYVRTYQKGRGKLHQHLPDYLNDLNAMHEAEKTLNPIQAAGYVRILTSIAWQSEQPVFAPMTAKADQRAEAFLKTIGKWEDIKGTPV